MTELSDLFAEILYFFPFLLFFSLVSLIVLDYCISIGFLPQLILTLNSKRRGKIPPAETLEC